MTDQSAYVNAYLENTVAMLHDQLNQIIQLKTQVKMFENLIAQKDSTIADLSSKITSEKEVMELKEKLRIAEDSHHGLLNKLSHMETLQNQFNELKKAFREKEKDSKKAPTKKAINNKNREDVLVVPEEPTPTEQSNKKSDDF